VSNTVELSGAVYARRFVSLVKFEHTVFALPFAYVGTLLSVHGVPAATTICWVTVAMVGARSLAMALNRLIDAEIDARNPRTAGRELPAGLLSPGQVAAFSLGALAVFLVAVWQLDPLVRWLWPIPVAAFVIYPYLKRFTWLCHLGLGLSTGLAPLGAWLAVTGDVAVEPFALWLAVALWIGGFDIIYATTDVEFDRREGLHSLPSRFGVAAGLTVTRVAHVGAVCLLIAVGVSLGLGPFYFLGLAVVAALLAYENGIVRPDDLSRVNVAFFTLNGIISIIFLAGVLADVLA
jgi:4-hydroxybenzoate polyprenyltransferase